MIRVMQVGHIYKNHNKGGEFNFTITTGTFLYAVTTLVIHWRKNIEFHMNFTNYFQYLHDYFADKKNVTLEDVLRQVYQIGKIGNKGGWQLPAVRPPGWQEFKEIDLKKMERITIQKVQKHKQSKKPIVIKNKDAVILNVKLIEAVSDLGISHLEVNVPINIKQKVPSFFSMSPNTAMYNFHSIKSDLGFISLIKGFIPMRKQSFARTYYISKVICRNDIKHDQGTTIGATESQLTFDHVVIINNAPHPTQPSLYLPYNGVLFRYKNVFYSSTWSDINEGLWNVFDGGSLPNLEQIGVSPLPTYAGLYEVYIKSVSPSLQAVVREIIQSVIQKKPDKESQKHLMQVLQRLKNSLYVLRRML